MSTNNNQCLQIRSYYDSITTTKRASLPLYVVIYLWMPSIAYVTDLSAPVLITFKTLNPFLSCSSICRQTVLDTVQICSFWLLTCVITNSYLFSGFPCASKNLGFSTGFILCLSRSYPITYVVPGFGLKYWLDVTTSSSISSTPLSLRGHDIIYYLWFDVTRIWYVYKQVICFCLLDIIKVPLKGCFIGCFCNRWFDSINEIHVGDTFKRYLVSVYCGWLTTNINVFGQIDRVTYPIGQFIAA